MMKSYLYIKFPHETSESLTKTASFLNRCPERFKVHTSILCDVKGSVHCSVRPYTVRKE